MKLKAIDILNLYDAFANLSGKELDLNTACTIAKNINILSVTKKIIDEKRNRLISDYAVKDSNGGIITDENGAVKSFTDKETLNQKLNDLFLCDVDVDNMNAIAKNALSDIKISPQALLVLLQSNLLDEE